MNLSKRERILLLILAFLLFWYAAARFLILPLYEREQGLRLESESLAMQKQQIQQVIARYADIEFLLEKEKEQMSSEAYFYRDIDDVFVDITLQELAGANGVAIESLEIALPSETAVDPYYENLRILIYPIREQKALVDGATLPYQEQPAEGDESVVPMYQCVLRVQAPLDNAIAFVEDIRLLGRSVFVSAIGSEPGTVNIVDGLFVDNITVNFYYLED